jgi:hypothetical protein
VLGAAGCSQLGKAALTCRHLAAICRSQHVWHLLMESCRAVRFLSSREHPHGGRPCAKDAVAWLLAQAAQRAGAEVLAKDVYRQLLRR